MNNLYSFSIVLVLSIFVFAGCQKKVEERKFQEVFVESEQPTMAQTDPHAGLDAMPDDDIHAAFRAGKTTVPEGMGQMPDDDIHAKFRSGGMMMGDQQEALMKSVAPVALLWTTPQGWKEEKGNGMRLATFTAGEGSSAVETTIISLAGEAGGMAANVGRWMGQLNIDVPSAKELDEFISKQQKIKTDSGLPVTVIDLSQLQKGSDPLADSMIAAVLENQESRIFIKMTGTKDAIVRNAESFKSLVTSMRSNSK